MIKCRRYGIKLASILRPNIIAFGFGLTNKTQALNKIGELA